MDEVEGTRAEKEPTPTFRDALLADHCGHPGEELIPDPFISDVENEIVWRWLCDDCAYERRMEI